MIKEILYKWFGIEKEPCPSCLVLQQQLAFANDDRQRLLELILKKNEPEVQVRPIPENIKPISQGIPWNVRRQMLEQDDREKARVLRERKIDTDKLEKDLGLGENARESAEESQSNPVSS